MSFKIHSCGYVIENTENVFFNCQKYNDLRINFFAKVSAIALPTLKTILYGDDILLLNHNQDIFDAVHEFIILAKSFD